MNNLGVSDIDWKNSTLVAFDAETDGAYPLGFDFCELGAVKWRDGQIIDKYETLVKPRKKMSDFVIGIHGITNEMVQDAPLIEEVLPDFLKFIDGCVLLAHHAPFDVGFLMADIEKYNLSPPQCPILCTSLLSRHLIPESSNHKLQTLMKFFDIKVKTAHRALEDAISCLKLALKCFERTGPMSIKKLQKMQGGALSWEDFSILNLNQEIPGFPILIDSLNEGVSCVIRYQGGSTPGKERTIKPLGIVRRPDKDFIQAHCQISKKDKRFYLDKIVAITR